VPADGRVDLDALGAIARLLLVGPGRGPRRQGPLPAALSHLLARALSARVEERFHTAAELKAALLAAIPDEAPAASPEPPRPPAPGSPPPPSAPGVPEPPPPAVREPEPSSPPPLEVRGEFRDDSGRDLGTLRCIHLSRGGLFACTGGPFPPLLSRLTLTLHGGGERVCTVEVVRHVDEAQGRAWGMPAGFGVQFLEPSRMFQESLAFKGALDHLLQGPPLEEPRPAAPRDDSRAAPLLAEVLARSATDPYAFLSLPRDAPMADVRQRAREEQKRREGLRGRPLSSAQLEQLQEGLRRVGWALSLLGHPARRAEHDARLGNFLGVARCIAAGLPTSELGTCRQRYLTAHRTAETRARVHALTGHSFEEQGQLERALAQYESALELDALNLDLHRAYWALKHRAAAPRTPAPVGR
jgi:serine/threonine-protein kinase